MNPLSKQKQFKIYLLFRSFVFPSLSVRPVIKVVPYSKIDVNVSISFVLFSNLMFCETNKLKKICGHRISFQNTVSRRLVFLRNLHIQMLKSTKIGGR